MASIAVTALARAAGAGWAVALRGDDLEVVVPVAARLGTPAAWGILGVGIAGGIVLAGTLLRLSGGVAPAPSEPANPPARI